MFRICFLVQLPPPVHGSANISKILVESPIINNAFNLTVIPLHFAKDNKQLGFFSLSKVAKMIGYGLRLISVLRSFKPDVVYFTVSPKGLSFYRDVCYVFILKLWKSKIVYHLHVKGIKEESEESSLKKILYKCIFKNTYVITLSDMLAYDLEAVYGKQPFIVNNGIQNVIHDDNILSRPASRKPKILFLSNLMKLKGVFVLLQALVLLKRKTQHFHAVIAGNNADLTRTDVENFIAANNIADCVVVKNGMYATEKYEAFKDAYLFVHPTLNDAFPLVILEAMQFGLPVISTIEGSIPEIVDDGVTGILIAKNDAQALAEKIEYLLREGDTARKMGSAGRAKFLAEYTSEKMEQNVKEVLMKICSDKV